MIFYVYRDPRDVMVSFWKFIAHWPWHEGPKTATCREFIRDRRRARRCVTSISRRNRCSTAGVRTWTAGRRRSAAGLRNRICYVRFEDLHEKYECTIDGIAEFLGERPVGYRRPSPQENGIFPSEGKIGAYREHFERRTWTCLGKCGRDDDAAGIPLNLGQGARDITCD